MDKREALKTYFGHDDFRPGQEPLIDALLAGHDALGIMPTGAGKSMCYQIPALLQEGIALVVSPLISLMKDQVAALIASGVRAAYLNSSLTPGQMDRALDNARQGMYKIIYVAPERLDTPGFMSFARNAPISLIAVDEAHCVSQWGQDFRPNYLKIADFVDALPKRPPVGAFTATATQRVRDDIRRLLRLRDPEISVTGFDRPNLYFEVLRPKKRFETLKAILEDRPFDSGVIYCSTRKNVEDVCEKLLLEGFAAARYHAGLSDEERQRNQEAFQYDRARIMVATNAFGMGIDKSNVRYVIHYNMPKSMEAYYQEAGRAGRDGDDAECILLYNGQDIITAKYLINNSEPNPELTPQEQAAVKAQDMRRLQQMIDYATGTGCLRASILRYFGEQAPAKCENCSNCVGKRYAEAEAMGLTPGMRAAAATGSYDPNKRLGVPEIKLPAPKPKKTVANATEEESGDDLFSALRSCRTRLAAEKHVPAYIILPDSALHDMARLQPTSLNELLNVKGMGTMKVSQYGDAFLQAIRAWKLKHPAAPRPDKVQTTAMRREDYRSALMQGLTPAQPWSREEEERLRRGYQAGVTVRQLSVIHGREEEDVRARLKSLGLII